MKLFWKAFFRSAITALKSPKTKCLSRTLLLLQKPMARVGLEQELLLRKPLNPRQEFFYLEEQSSKSENLIEKITRVNITKNNY